MIFDNQLRYAIDIIGTYRGDIPLHAWLKDYFRVHRQMGSRDRKLLGALVYSFYRLGHAQRHVPVKERLLEGLYVCTDQPSDLLRRFHPDRDPQAPVAEKLQRLGIDPTDIFPWKDELSPAIDHVAFCLSFLRQPDLFVRVRPGHLQAVSAKLADIGEFVPPAAFRLPNGFNLESLFKPDREVVIQDLSSQRILEFLTLSRTPGFFWDACAGSGGKSILAHDLYPGLYIFASDIRESILHNLRGRFHAAGIRQYTGFLADLSQQPPPAPAAGADLVLADLPCTGSGTWSRTPESLYFFDPSSIQQYADRQRAILRRIAPQLAPGASLVYCTCSVFKKENEDVINWLESAFPLQPDLVKVIAGYADRADTLFAARFRRGGG